MTTITDKGLNSADAEKVQDLATRGLFASLAIVFLWFGAMKFTAYEAGAIRGLVENSPFLGWLYSIFSERTVSGLIGTVELAIAGGLIARLWRPEIAVLGAIAAIITFIITFSFFFTTPGVYIPDTGVMAISVLPGQFLLKDIVLLFASVFALGNALAASK